MACLGTTCHVLTHPLKYCQLIFDGAYLDTSKGTYERMLRFTSSLLETNPWVRACFWTQRV